MSLEPIPVQDVQMSNLEDDDSSNKVPNNLEQSHAIVSRDDKCRKKEKNPESKWKIIRNNLATLRAASYLQSRQSRNNSTPENPDDFDDHIDLRSIPMRINENDSAFDRILTLTKVLEAFKTAGKQTVTTDSSSLNNSPKRTVHRNISAPTKAEREREKIRRQQEALEAYTTVYDLKSGKMVNYLELERKQSDIGLGYFPEPENMQTKRKSKCTIL